MTDIFDPEDDYIHSDAVSVVKGSLIAEFGMIKDEKRIAPEGADSRSFDMIRHFVLAPAK